MKILKALQLRPQEGNVGLTRTVSEIIARVRTEGDRALMDYNEKFDHCTRPAFRVSKEEIENAYRQATQQDLEDMRRTQTNLETFAQDGALPQILTKVNPKFRTPYVAILFLGLLTFLLVLTNSMNYIASVSLFADLFTYTLGITAAYGLRKKLPDLRRPYRAPFILAGTVISIAAYIIMITQLGSSAIISGIVWSVLGMALYFAYQL